MAKKEDDVKVVADAPLTPENIDTDIGVSETADDVKAVREVAIPSRRGDMTKAKAKEMGLDPSVYGKIDAG